MSATRPTAVVVGSGPAGATVARVLARSGMFDVVVLEKGRNLFTGLDTGDPAKLRWPFANDEIDYETDAVALFDQDPFLEPRTFRTDTSVTRSYVGDVDNLATTVGGSYAHADVKARRLREVDFIANSLLGGTPDTPAIPGTTYADWPVTYQMLEPFYAVTEEVVGIQGPARWVDGAVRNPNPYESPRSTPFPLPPGVAMLSSLLPAEAARRLGYHPAPVPTAALSRPYPGRPNPCNDCGFCNDFGCPNGAKGGGIWQLVDAVAAGATVVAGANAVRLEYGDAPNPRTGRLAVTGVRWLDRDGQPHLQPADLVVLANNPIEATRLCLLSGIGTPPSDAQPAVLHPGATDPSGLLGRNLMLHLQTVVLAVLNTDIHSFRGRTSTHTLDAFAGPGPSPAAFDPAVPMGGILEIGGNENPIQQALNFAALGIGARHQLVMRFAPVVNRITTFTMQGQDMPQVTNTVDLDPDIVDIWGIPVPRITYKNHPYELAASAYYTPRMMEIMEAIGGPGSRTPAIRPIAVAALNTTTPAALPGQLDSGLTPVTGATPFSDIPADKHLMGTHRAALDAAHGVCDPYGRLWAFDNLYCAGGALFPTAPGFNPTVTIYALSYWLAAAVVAGVGGKPSYTMADVQGSWPDLLQVIRRIDGGTMAAYAIANGLLVP